MVRAGRDIALASMDWAKLIRPGELVAWSQASAEPVTPVASLLESRARIGGFRAFVGISNSSHVDTRYTDHAGTDCLRDVALNFAKCRFID